MSQTCVLLDQLTFPEGPRWHNGRLFVSDFYSHRVLAIEEDGTFEVVCTVPNQPSGLGWTPDGQLLVVSMLDRRLLRLEGKELREVADLSGVAPSHCNDMVVDRYGNAFIGNFGFDRRAGQEPRKTNLVRVRPDGQVQVVARDLWFPNGSAITEDGTTLVVAETRAARLTAWTLNANGDLSDRRTWADLGQAVPDGICLDAEGAIWFADPAHQEVVRVAEGGRVLDRIAMDRRGAYACMLGGADRRTLFLCTSTLSGPKTALERTGRIETVRVEVPGAGLP